MKTFERNLTAGPASGDLEPRHLEQHWQSGRLLRMKLLAVTRHLVALALACTTATASAGFVDGNTLYNRMTANNFQEESYALGYIAGVTDATHGVLHCAPPNVQLGQLRDMVFERLLNAPAIRDLEASLIVALILQKRWPCKPAQKL